MTSQAKQSSTGTIEEALALTEEALGHVTRIAIEQIRNGRGISTHVEAAERDIRSALQQLGLASRERPPQPRPARAGEHTEMTADALPNTH
jgi:hypothetical protein